MPQDASQTVQNAPQNLRLRACSVDLRRRVVSKNGDERRLTTREAELLGYLASKPGSTVTRDELLREVWGYQRTVNTRAVDDTMKRLRPKVEADPRRPNHLITVHGSGFRFEPLREVSRPTPQLEQPADGFIGRRAELEQLADLFAAGATVVSIIGPGGMGKTRLATQFAHRQDSFEVVRSCDFASCRTREEMEQAISTALGLGGGPDPITPLAESLKGLGPALFILDTVDRVTDHAEAIHTWSSYAPELRWLVTSCTRLGLAGERPVLLAPLSASDGVELFCLRARAVDASFSLSADERRATARLVLRVDGMPLAIELAAARVGVMQPSLMLERLEDRFRLLARHGSQHRHAAVEATIAWSWAELDAPQQLALAQLSVFAPTFRLDAVEAVVQLEADAPWAVDVLQSLRDRSLVRATGSGNGGQPLRFSLLESVRLFASARLDELGDRAETEQRFCDYYLTWCQSRMGLLESRHRERSQQEVAHERDNLIAVHARAIERHPHDAISVVMVMDRGLHGHGQHTLLAGLADAAIAARAANTDEERAGLLRVRGYHRFMAKGAPEACENDIREAIDLSVGLDDPRTLIESLSALANILVDLRRFQEAEEPISRALHLAEQARHRPLLAMVRTQRARTYLVQGLLEEAHDVYAGTLRLLQEVGDRRTEGVVLGNLGALCLDEGRIGEAIDLLERSIAIHAEVGNGASEAIQRYNRACALLVTARTDEASTEADRAASAAFGAGFAMGDGLAALIAGAVAHAVGDLEAARSNLQAAGDTFEDLAARSWRAYASLHEAAVGLSEGLPDAAINFQRCLDHMVAEGCPVREPMEDIAPAWHAYGHAIHRAERGAPETTPRTSPLLEPITGDRVDARTGPIRVLTAVLRLRLRARPQLDPTN